MSDSQQLGLGELGQRVQAMGGPAPIAQPAPAAPPASAPPTQANPPAPDSRLRPYQAAPLPISSLSSRGPLPSWESLEEARNALPQAPASPPPSHPQAPHSGPSAAPPPVPGSASAGHVFNSNPVRPFESLAAPAPTSWEQVSVPSPAFAHNPAQGQAQASESSPPSSSEAEGTVSSGGTHAASGLQTGVATAGGPKSGFQRALDAVRSAIPVLQKLLPLLDGNFATAVGALMAPQPNNQPAPVAVDLEPVERGLAEVRTSNRELRNQVLEQGASLKRVEDQLERVREATDRNTLEQQELVEDLRAVGSRISTLAIVGIVLLVLSLAANGFLLFELQHILR